jgi:hypothetical protein
MLWFLIFCCCEPDVTEDELRTHFAACGAIESVRLIRDKATYVPFINSPNQFFESFIHSLNQISHSLFLSSFSVCIFSLNLLLSCFSPHLSDFSSVRTPKTAMSARALALSASRRSRPCAWPSRSTNRVSAATANRSACSRPARRSSNGGISARTPRKTVCAMGSAVLFVWGYVEFVQPARVYL